LTPNPARLRLAAATLLSGRDTGHATGWQSIMSEYDVSDAGGQALLEQGRGGL
jgi:hypothetical protein